MKIISVKYGENGQITDVSDNSMYFEQENESLRITATINTDKKVRAYIKAPNDNSTVTDEIPLNDGTYSFVVDSAYMAKGTLYIGFEVYDESGYIERYEPLKIYIDSFVSLSADKNDNVYVVTVSVGEVETLEPGEPATVENVGNKKDMILKFGIPKGEKGDKGDTGEQGPQGIQGVQGEKGEPFVYEDFTEEQLELLRGPQGQQGEQGIQGIQGIQGEKGEPGENATIEIAGVVQLESGEMPTVENTGSDINAKFVFGIPKGQQGIQGEKGDTGPQGEKGDKGDKGDTGEQGPQGIQGVQGIQGEKGDKGDTGEVSLEYAHSTFAPVIENTANGETIQLTDSADEKLKGLNVFGKTNQQKSTGINLFDCYGVSAATINSPTSERVEINTNWGTTIDSIDYDGTIKVTQSKTDAPDDPTHYGNGYFVIGVRGLEVGKTYTLTYDIDISNNPLNYNKEMILINSVYRGQEKSDGGNKRMFVFVWKLAPNAETKECIEVRNAGKNATYKNFMLLEGEVAFEDLPDYEPYSGGFASPSIDWVQPLNSVGDKGNVELTINEQSLNIATPNGLCGIPVTSGGNYTDSNGKQWMCDEVDFDKSVYIQRIDKLQSYNGEIITTPYMSTTGELSNGATVVYVLDNPIEIPLTEEQISAYKALQTYKPTTIITNDEDAYMKVNYVADTKNYIDNKFAELQNAILSTGGNI